ncbi:MAG: hypothetical protein ISS45_05190 [Candidatus Omnitrophica bacterium]|nr:hypothetical protein [Candidatus Omnitrophota bacterium]
MARQELVEKAEFEKAVGLKGNLGSFIISIFKFILSIILLPLVIGITKVFLQQLYRQPQYILNNFVFAVATYLILHIFVCQPRSLYDFGQRIIGRLFSFFVPLRRAAYHCLPLYATLLFILYFVFKAIFGYGNIIGYFVFLISFTAIMHLILTAAYLKGESLGVLKGDYFLSLFFVYLFEIILISGFLSVILKGFSFVDPVKDGYNFFVNTHISIWRQFFVLK